jgi:hypothetical protein
MLRMGSSLAWLRWHQILGAKFIRSEKGAIEFDNPKLAAYQLTRLTNPRLIHGT